MTPEPLQLRTLHAHRWGGDGRPVLCIPGLSANSWSFQAIAEVLASGGRTVVALDLRGRGLSPATAPGSYGWPAHARDVLAAADELGWPSFDVIGHSMGAFITLQLLSLPEAKGRARRSVLIDALGRPDATSLKIIEAGLARLGATAPNADAYVEAVRGRGAVVPWHPQWDRHYRYELEPLAGGEVRARTSAAAVAEDFAWGNSHDASALWPALSEEALVIRATQPLLASLGGHVITEEDLNRLRAQHPGVRTVDVPANHFGVMTHADTLNAIKEHLDG